MFAFVSVNRRRIMSLGQSHSLDVSRPLLSVLPVPVLRVVFDSVDVFVTFLTSGYWASKRLVVCRFTFLSLLYHTAKQNHGLSYCKTEPWFIILQNRTKVYHNAKTKPWFIILQNKTMVYFTAKQNRGLSYCKTKPWFIILQNKTMVYHTAKQNQ